MKKYKNKIISGIIIALILTFAYWYGGDAPGMRGMEPRTEEDVTVISNEKTTLEKNVAEEEINDIPGDEKNEPSTEDIQAEKTASADGDPESIQEHPEESKITTGKAAEKDKYKTDPGSEGKPIPVEPETAVITDEELTCTLSIRCDTVLENIAWLDKDKVDIVPEDGVIFAEKTVTFYEGESVFNLLLREMKRNKIHMEFENTPIYNSAYIEGIANLYEFDCGELSGWMYKVNGWFPNYGCSRYQLKSGDKVEWVYTCDLGVDVGGHYSARNGS